MLNNIDRFKHLALATVLAATFTVTLHSAFAGKPGGATLIGTIYYRTGDGYVASPADGKNSTLLPVTGCPGLRLHAGSRWFVFGDEIEGEFDPEGFPRYELFAMREDGTHIVRLTDQIDLQVYFGTTSTDSLWLNDDGLLTFEAIARDPLTSEPLTAGVYVAPIAYDANDNVIGLAAQPDPLTPVIEFPVYEYPDSGYLRPDASFTWSPDLTAIAWSPHSSGELHVTDLLTDPPTDTVIALDDIAAPTWSPDGSRIAFWNHSDIDSIRPDGSDWSIVDASGASGKKTVWFQPPYWSPDSTHLVYGGGERVRGGAANTSYFIATHSADGSGRRNVLDSDSSFTPYPLGWRK